MPILNPVGSCVAITLTPRELCVTFPVAQEMCVSLPQVNIPDIGELLQQMFGMINTALSPLNPIFNILDAVIAVFDCVKAIPEAILQLDPTGLIDCIPGLAQAIDKLLQLIPQLSLPIMLVEVIDVIILWIEAQLATLQRYAARIDRILAAETAAAEPGNFALAAVVDCINANFDVDVQNLNEQNAPVNRLIGLINFFLDLIGLPCLPTIGGFTEISQVVIDAFQLLVDLLRTIRNLIPIPSGSGGSIGKLASDCG